MLDIDKIRLDFPILKQKINNKPIIYADNAATTQKPSSVINSIKDYYENINSNVHRSSHFLSAATTEKFEKTRTNVKKFINAKSEEEIIFTKGTTESINIVASCMTQHTKENDEILISALEHHSNIVPWQLLCKRTKAKINVIPINENHQITIDNLKDKINNNTKIIAITNICNSIGIVVPIEQIIKEIRKISRAWILIDGAQSIAHTHIDVQKLDADFFVFSSHKLYGTHRIRNTIW